MFSSMEFDPQLAIQPSDKPCAWRQLAVGWVCLVLAAGLLTGCGTTKTFTATEQLLLSDAVDATVSKIDFSPLAGKRVYLDSTYLKTVKSTLLVDSDYVISSLRQQMVGAGVLLVEARDEADIVAEARLGALGMDGHNVVYGVPASSALSSASAAISGTPVLPAIPEISVARREGRLGAAKLAVFAYDRESRQPYWQSGIAKSTSNAKDTWLLGVGPFQRGTIYNGTRFAGSRVLGELMHTESDKVRETKAFADYHRTRNFTKSTQLAKNQAAEAEALRIASNPNAGGATDSTAEAPAGESSAEGNQPPPPPAGGN